MQYCEIHDVAKQALNSKERIREEVSFLPRVQIFYPVLLSKKVELQYVWPTYQSIEPYFVDEINDEQFDHRHVDPTAEFRIFGKAKSEFMILPSKDSKLIAKKAPV